MFHNLWNCSLKLPDRCSTAAGSASGGALERSRPSGPLAAVSLGRAVSVSDVCGPGLVIGSGKSTIDAAKLLIKEEITRSSGISKCKTSYIIYAEL